MSYYPVFLALKDKRVAVLGGGQVALRKVKALLACGARVEVASLRYCRELSGLARRHPRLKLKSMGAAKNILRNALLVLIASSDDQWNKKWVKECRRRRIWANVADQPGLCDFILPAHFKKGRLQVAISTGGTSPLLARRFREELAQQIRPQAVRMLDRMKVLRQEAQQILARPSERKRFLENKLGKGFHFFYGRNGNRSKNQRVSNTSGVRHHPL